MFIKNKNYISVCYVVISMYRWSKNCCKSIEFPVMAIVWHVLQILFFSFSGVSVSILVLPILLLILRFLGGAFLNGRICSGVIGRPEAEVGTPDVPGCSSSFTSISDGGSWTRMAKIHHQ